MGFCGFTENLRARLGLVDIFLLEVCLVVTSVTVSHDSYQSAVPRWKVTFESVTCCHYDGWHSRVRLTYLVWLCLGSVVCCGVVMSLTPGSCDCPPGQCQPLLPALITTTAQARGRGGALPCWRWASRFDTQHTLFMFRGRRNNVERSWDWMSECLCACAGEQEERLEVIDWSWSGLWLETGCEPLSPHIPSLSMHSFQSQDSDMTSDRKTV